MPKKAKPYLRTKYKKNFPHCEVYQYMPREDLQEVMRLGRVSVTEVNHIFRLGGRYDHPSNFATVNFVIHKHWGHDANDKKLKILCLYAKFLKSRAPQSELNPHPELEFNLDVLNAAAGKRVLGLLEIYQSELPEHSDYWQMCRLITESH
jgi:hypothetical protein